MKPSQIVAWLDEVEHIDGPERLIVWYQLLVPDPMEHGWSTGQRAIIASRLARLAKGSNQFKAKYKKLRET